MFLAGGGSAERLGKPAVSGDFAFGGRREIGLLHVAPCRGDCAFDLAQGLDDLGLADPAEIVRGCRCEPCGHIELERIGEKRGVLRAGSRSFERLRCSGNIRRA